MAVAQSIAEASRLVAIGCCVTAIPVVVIRSMTGLLSSLRKSTEQSEGQNAPWPLLLIMVPLGWAVPAILILFRIGEASGEWPLIRIIGSMLCIAGAATVISATVALGRLLVPKAVVLPDHELITRGPYRWVRHPIYSGLVMLTLGSALATLNWLLLIFSLATIQRSLIQAQAEEKVLEEKFGDDYRAYARNTGRFIPRLASESAS